jgi:hypothetical protein
MNNRGRAPQILLPDLIIMFAIVRSGEMDMRRRGNLETVVRRWNDDNDRSSCGSGYQRQNTLTCDTLQPSSVFCWTYMVKIVTRQRQYKACLTCYWPLLPPLTVTLEERAGKLGGGRKTCTKFIVIAAGEERVR